MNSTVTIEERESRALSRAIDFVVCVDGVEIYRDSSRKRCEFVKLWTQARGAA